MVVVYDLGEASANLRQPFWMLPTLALLGLRAKDIMGYTFAMSWLLRGRARRGDGLRAAHHRLNHARSAWSVGPGRVFPQIPGAAGGVLVVLVALLRRLHPRRLARHLRVVRGEGQLGQSVGDVALPP